MQSSRLFNKQYLKKLPVAFIVLVALFAGALLLFVVIIHEVLWEQEAATDNAIFNFLSAHVINSRLTAFMEGGTYFASATFLQIAYGALVLWYLLFKNRKRVVEILTTGVGGFIINYCMKLSFHRLRPPHPLIQPLQNFSFPSGHATSAFIFYGLLSYLVWKTKIPALYKYITGILLISFSLLIGFSRVYLRVHYPSDVLAGVCVGFAWLLLSIVVLERLKKKTDQEVQPRGG